VESKRLSHDELLPEGERQLDSPLRGTWTPPNPSMMTGGVYWGDLDSIRRFYRSTLGRLWLALIGILATAFVGLWIVFRVLSDDRSSTQIVITTGIIAVVLVVWYILVLRTGRRV
jgi:hypothetical protein